MITTIIFDLGGVLIDWNPKYLYRKIFAEEYEMQHFLDEICTADWNEEQDAGRSLHEATELLATQYPKHKENIQAYYGRWQEMLGGVIAETVEIFKKLRATEKFKFYALTNWSAETFPVALQQFELLNWFDGIVVSGTEKMRKPSPEFYRLLLNRYDIQASEALFIDDNLRNIEAARAVGIDSIHFVSADQLGKQLAERGIL